MRGPRLRIAAAALVAVAGTALTFGAAPAHAAACEQGTGVTVVVDFASLGGGTQTTCAEGDPDSGLDALRRAGHEPTRAAQQPGYFVCRIDGKPANDPCQRTSPEDAYWSYWTARPGGSWTYSNVGAADSDPEPGSVEGWAFGAGKPPSSPPPREGAPAPAPSPTRASSPAAPPPAAPSSPQAPTAAATSTGASPTTSPTASPTTPPSASASTSASASPSASPSGSGSPSADAAAGPAESPVPGEVVVDRLADDGPGSLVGALVALGVVLLLAAAGAYQRQQRRRDAAV